MVTRQQAEEALAHYLEQQGIRTRGSLVDGGGGRWLVIGPGRPLAVSEEGDVTPADEVFSPQEHQRLLWSLP
jgi:hypothetical protein